MIIEFSWGTGKLSVDAKILIVDMPMADFKKWVKLFARYGEPADHKAFLQLLDAFSANVKEDAEPMEAELAEFQAKAEGRIFSQLTPEYCQTQVKRIQRHLNGINRTLKRYQTMHDLLKGLVS